MNLSVSSTNNQTLQSTNITSESSSLVSVLCNTNNKLSNNSITDTSVIQKEIVGNKNEGLFSQSNSISVKKNQPTLENCDKSTTNNTEIVSEKSMEASKSNESVQDENKLINKEINNVEEISANSNTTKNVEKIQVDAILSTESGIKQLPATSTLSTFPTEQSNIINPTQTLKKRGRPRKDLSKNVCVSASVEPKKQPLESESEDNSKSTLCLESSNSEFASPPARMSARIKFRKSLNKEFNTELIPNASMSKMTSETIDNETLKSPDNCLSITKISTPISTNSGGHVNPESDQNIFEVKDVSFFAEVNSTASVKKRRGRPSKASLEQLNMNLSQKDANFFKCGNINEISGQISLKKRRGRPSKASLEQLNMNLSQKDTEAFKYGNVNETSGEISYTSDANSSMNVEKPRKRGRKKKNENKYMEMCNSSTESTPLNSSNVGQKESAENVLGGEENTNSPSTANLEKNSLSAIKKCDISQPFLKIERRGRPRKYPLKISAENSYEKTEVVNKSNSFGKKYRKKCRLSKIPYTDDDNISEEFSRYSELVQADPLLDPKFRKSPRKGHPKKCARYADINSAIKNCNQFIDDSSSDGEEFENLKKRKISRVKYSNCKGFSEQSDEIPDISISFSSNTTLGKEGRHSDIKHPKRIKNVVQDDLNQDLQSDQSMKVDRDASCKTPMLSSTTDSESEESLNKSFVQEKKNLFEHFKPKKPLWRALSESEQVQYYPPLIKSIPLKDKTNQTDIELNCFESMTLEDSKHYAFFTGAPMWSSAWCPTPSNKKVTQYIAIATSGNLAEYHSYTAVSDSKSLLQFWNLGDLQNPNFEHTPSMPLCVVFNHGNIFDMAWCPTGCWEDPGRKVAFDDMPRMGLLATASSDSFIRIYSIPHPDFTNATSSNFPLYDATPTAVLKPLCSNIGSLTEKSACMTLNWEKTGNCERIVGGYGNGLICVWLISTSSSLLTRCHDENTFVPYLIFHAHGSPVTSVAFTPMLKSGWLVSTGFEKEVKFWNLNDPCMPVATVKDGYAFNVHFAALCCGAAINYHDTVSFRSTQFFRELEIESSTAISMDDCNTTSKKTAYSEELNALAIADNTGTITAKFVNSIHSLSKKFESKFPRRRTHAGKSTIPPLKPVENNILDPFVDSHVKSVNTISWNPNHNSCFWILAGGLSGVARLSCLHDLTLENCNS